MPFNFDDKDNVEKLAWFYQQMKSLGATETCKRIETLLKLKGVENIDNVIHAKDVFNSDN